MPKQCIKTMWFTLTGSRKTTFSNNNFTLLFLVWFYQCPKLLSKNCAPLFFTTLLQLIEVCGHSFVHSMLKIPPLYFVVEVSTLTETFHTLIIFIFNHFLVDLLLYLSFIFQIDDLTFDPRSFGCKTSPNHNPPLGLAVCAKMLCLILSVLSQAAMLFLEIRCFLLATVRTGHSTVMNFNF